MSTLDDLAAASEAMRRLDERRQQQQTYRDELIRQAIDAGHSWTEIKTATGLLNRSLQLAIKRTERDS